jgi:hydroxyacylglutathione hydrolase
MLNITPTSDRDHQAPVRRHPRSAALAVVAVPVLDDNYVWLLHDSASDDTVVVDPGEADPVLAVAAARGWTIRQVWNTHWHADHVAGNAAIVAATGATLTVPAHEAKRIGAGDVLVAAGDTVAIGGHQGTILELPGHTAGHIAFHLQDDRLIFVGDALFAMGCGRLFEGDAAQLWHTMRQMDALPAETQIYCAHEYTLANGRFALVAEPENEAIVARMVQVEAARQRGDATIPTTIATERATNPFLRAGSIDDLTALRAARDLFR